MQIKKTLEIPPHTSQCVYLHTHLEIISMFHSKNHHDKSNSLFFFYRGKHGSDEFICK